MALDMPTTTQQAVVKSVPPARTSTPTQPSTNMPYVPLTKHLAKPHAPPKSTGAPLGGDVSQGGVGNQQIEIRGTIEQNNSGGCNQQVVGGGNTNNCVPPDRQLSQSQKNGIASLAAAIPVECELSFSAADSGDPEQYAYQLANSTPRNKGFTLLMGSHRKGIFLFIHDANDPCAKAGMQFAKGLRNLGVNVDLRSYYQPDMSPRTILIFVGEQ